MTEDDPLPRPSAEARDASYRLVAAMAGVMAIIVTLGLLSGRLAIGRATAQNEAALRGPTQLFQNGVVAKTDVERSWEEIDKTASPTDDAYAWVDRARGVVQVPMDRAIDIVCGEKESPNPAPTGKGPPP